VVAIRGAADDVLSHGYICPKAVALKDLHEDPDRLRTPLVRRGGELLPATWDEAFAEIERRLPPIMAAHGRDAVAVTAGNPSAHKMELLLYFPRLAKAVATKNVFTASTLDQMPKQLSSGLMFGHWLSIPVPDIERSDWMLVIGANPMVSNGSLWTVPDFRGKAKALRARGGRLLVIDPRRSETAAVADEHHFIRPGSDVFLLAAMVQTLFEEGLVRLGRLAELVNGVDAVRDAVQPFTPERVAARCAIGAATIRRLARELAAAPRACVYGRIGTCTQSFGTLCSWLVDVLNALTGRLDEPGGVMFPKAAAFAQNTQGKPGSGRGISVGRHQARVSGAPEVFGELPMGVLAEEIETAGPGQIKALISVASNPVLSAPNGPRLAAAFERLEFMVSLDIYVNETTRHADVILPAPSPLERSHYDLALYQFAVRNVANYSPPALPRAADMLEEWETLLRLTGIVTGQGPDADVEALDAFVAGELVRREVDDPTSPVGGRDPAELLAALEPRRGPERLLDLLLRAGPYGDAFGARPDGLTLAALEAAPHGIDLGPLAPRLPEVLRTPSGKIELAPEQLVADVPRLRAALARGANGMLLIGRRQLRSNNSWMHNLPLLVKGKDRCTLQVHPTDAERLGLEDGAHAAVRSRAGEVTAPVEVTDAVMPGVVSLPHGWGHDQPGSMTGVAAGHAGVNSNVLADELAVEPLSGNAILNGIPVELTAVRAAEPAAVA